MKTNHLLMLILLSGLMVSCSDALYRSHPKADRHRGESVATESRKTNKIQTIVPDEVLQQERAEAESNGGSLAPKNTQPKEVAVIESSTEEVGTTIPEADQRAMDAVPVSDDTIEVEPEEHELMIEEAELSEKLARQLRGWGVVTIIGWFLWPLYFIGIIGGIVTIIRYKTLTFVSEKSIKAKRKAQNLFITAIVVPLVIIGLIFMLIYLSF